MPAKPTRPSLASVADCPRKAYFIDPRKLHRNEDLNKRTDYGTPEEWELFKASILADGVQTDATIRWNGRKWELVQGYRRHRAVLELIKAHPARKDELLQFPVREEGVGTSDVQRLAGQIYLNAGKDYTFLEKARVFDSIAACDPKLTHTEIAALCHVSHTAVADGLLLITATPITQQAVAQGKIAPYAVINLLKTKSPADTQAAVLEAIEGAAAMGKAKATPKHIRKQKDPGADAGGTPADPLVEVLLKHKFGSPAYTEAADSATVTQLQAALDQCEVAERSRTKREDLASRIDAKGVAPEMPKAPAIPTASQPTDFSQVPSNTGGGAGGGRNERVSLDASTNLGKLNKIMEEVERNECADPHQYDVIEAVINFLEGKTPVGEFKKQLKGGF